MISVPAHRQSTCFQHRLRPFEYGNPSAGNNTVTDISRFNASNLPLFTKMSTVYWQFNQYIHDFITQVKDIQIPNWSKHTDKNK